jgi:hypothetical protein
VLTLRADRSHSEAILATSELLTRQRLEFAFVGSVARAVWLEQEVSIGAVDVLAIMQPQQKNQVAMMASNRGFRVDRDEIEQSEELDLVPLHFGEGEADVRVHVLLASNALYARMVVAAVTLSFQSISIRVPTAEDFALLSSVGEDEEAVRRLVSREDFDRTAYNEKLVSIGLGGMILR